MDLTTILGLTAALLFTLLVLRRVERRALGVFIVVMVIPIVLLIALWAQFWGHWSEVGVAAALTLAISLGAWAMLGRPIQRATNDTIQVWGQEKMPRPTSAEAAEMRAELLRVKDERDRLEAEVKRLKDAGGD